jgi:putative DNA primase/helicase
VTLREKLGEEQTGILNWAIRGCQLWQREGLAPPEGVKDATASYREEMDVFGHFLSERCVMNPNAQEAAKSLYGGYLNWCHEAGEKKPASKTKFGLWMKERGFRPDKMPNGTRVWKGLSIRDLKEPSWVTDG